MGPRCRKLGEVPRRRNKDLPIVFGAVLTLRCIQCSLMTCSVVPDSMNSHGANIPYPDRTMRFDLVVPLSFTVWAADVLLSVSNS